MITAPAPLFLNDQQKISKANYPLALNKSINNTGTLFEHRWLTSVAQAQVANAVRYEVAAAAANIIGTEQPCRVRLRLWHCSADDPTASLEVPSLTIPDAVLCSEMGVHFSACGRFLAACVACQVCLSIA